MGTTSRASLPLLSILLAFACASSGRGGEATPTANARVNIENRSSLDMDIFARRQGGQAIRLGLAPANQTTAFALATAAVAGPGFLRFEARPVRRSGETVLSEPLEVRPGGEVTWSIPPQ